jgi:hypothetical protein
MKMVNRWTRGSDREGGATLVEFAVVLPLLLVLVFGIIEFGWAFAQVNDVRHGAREAARLAAVDYTGGVSGIGQETCNRMDIGGTPPITVHIEPVVGTDGTRGDTGKVVVSQTYDTLTGFFDAFLGGVTLDSDIEFRIEKPTTTPGAAWFTTPGTWDCLTGTFTP